MSEFEWHKLNKAEKSLRKNTDSADDIDFLLRAIARGGVFAKKHAFCVLMSLRSRLNEKTLKTLGELEKQYASYAYMAKNILIKTGELAE